MPKVRQAELFALLLSISTMVSVAALTVGIYEAVRLPNSAWPLAIILGGVGVFCVLVCWVAVIVELFSDG